MFEELGKADRSMTRELVVDRKYMETLARLAAELLDTWLSELGPDSPHTVAIPHEMVTDGSGRPTEFVGYLEDAATRHADDVPDFSGPRSRTVLVLCGTIRLLREAAGATSPMVALTPVPDEDRGAVVALLRKAISHRGAQWAVEEEINQLLRRWVIMGELIDLFPGDETATDAELLSGLVACRSSREGDKGPAGPVTKGKP